jgi:hypothetical protein
MANVCRLLLLSAAGFAHEIENKAAWRAVAKYARKNFKSRPSRRSTVPKDNPRKGSADLGWGIMRQARGGPQPGIAPAVPVLCLYLTN